MAAKVLPAHKNCDETASSPAAPRPMLNKEVKLDELSKYFHLPEKAVAKELGICLTSLKKLCRSYGITRWPFRKLKSLERTMRKVQTETDTNGPGGMNDDGGAGDKGEVKRKPYTVGNKTVFLSDEELEVFKMTMGKDASHELKPTPMSILEPALFNSATMAAASSALASVARGSDHAVDDCSISAEVKGRNLSIVNWSTLWSQPQLKNKLLDPLQGLSLRVSPDGVVADLEFAAEETAQRALRICRMAEVQAVQSAGPASGLLYAGQSILQASSTTATDPPTESGQTPPVSGVHALLSDGCLPAGLQPPSTHAQHSFWASFLSEGKNATATNGPKDAANGGPAAPATEGGSKKTAPKSIGVLGDCLPSPPMTSTAIGLLLESGEKVPAPLSMGAPMGTFFSNLFNSCPEGEPRTNGDKASPPCSSNSLSAYLQEGKEDKDGAAKEDRGPAAPVTKEATTPAKGKEGGK